MSSNNAIVDPEDDIMKQKKAAIRAEYTSSSADARPPAFNPAFTENHHQHHHQHQAQDHFTEEDIETLEDTAKMPILKLQSKNDIEVDNGTAEDCKMPSNNIRNEETRQRHYSSSPDTNEPGSALTSQLPHTMQLLQDKMMTANVIPIATEVVPDEEEAGGTSNGANDGANGDNNTNNSNIAQLLEEERKRRQKNKRLKVLLIAAIIVAVGAIGGAVGVIMSKNSNSNSREDESNKPKDITSLSVIAEPIKCSLSSISGNTISEPFFREPSCGGVAASTDAATGNKGKWFSFVGDGSCVTLSTCDSSTEFDTRIRIFRENSDGNRVCYTGNDDALENASMCLPSSLQSEVSFATDIGVLYYVFLDGFGQDDNGNFVMTIDCGACQKVPLTSQPTPQPTMGPSNFRFPAVPTSPLVQFSTAEPSMILPSDAPSPEDTNAPSSEDTDEYTSQPTPHPTGKNLFVSGWWREIEQVDFGAGCCVGQTLAFSSNKMVLALSNDLSEWGGISGAGTVTIFRRGTRPILSPTFPTFPTFPTSPTTPLPIEQKPIALAEAKSGITTSTTEYNSATGIALQPVLTSTVFIDTWVKVGTVHGQTWQENLGSNIALSGDGSLLVVSNKTHIHTYRVYQSFSQKLNDNLLFPPSGKIALSSDGTVLALSNYTSSKGSVQTYRFTGNKWISFGGIIITNPSTSRVSSIGISEDGSILALGTSKGSAVAYQFSPLHNIWVQFASWSFGDGFGVSLALSDDGKVLAVGQYGNIKTFNLGGISGTSGIRGPDIPYFENGGGSIEAASLSLSSDGSVLILGNHDEDYNYEIDGKINVGMALAYHFDDDLKWRQFGGDLKETSSSVDFGHTVAVSADGTELAVAASCDGGCTFIYRLERSDT
mmetsp:Transcript_9632/g.12901  ORF Transcript_9632/g.12901 Transcript_9632/m.12901 type:complete len:884 (+) Transcript_9632:157-2808(+)